jgi:hypothetical protein
MKRLDDLNRTERYFTSTLFGGLLIHNDLLGVKKFLTWLIKEKEVFLHKVGDLNDKTLFILPVIVPEHIEVNTEFNTKRDLKYYNKPLADLDVLNFSERQNVPDVIIIYGEVLIVIEGKFFVSGQSASVIDQQLRMQKEEITLMIDYLKPQIKYWLHIFLGPNYINLSNCDLQLTWKEIEVFSKELLGDNHYITERLHYANVRYFEKNNNSVSKSTNLNTPTKSRNYADTADFDEIKTLCRTHRENILVGFTGGKSGLHVTQMKELERRKFKYDFKNKLQGKKSMSNWINGLAFHDIITQKQTSNGKIISLEL